MSTALAVHALVAQVSDLTTQLQQLKTKTENPSAVPPADHTARYVEPRLPPPAVYSEESTVAFVITLLSGRAALWGTAVWEQKHQCCSSFQSFSEELNKVFDRAVSGREAAQFFPSALPRTARCIP
ncbi:hypothetical protein M9458_033390, partial [Cirrhinus mrigala]